MWYLILPVVLKYHVVDTGDTFHSESLYLHNMAVIIVFKTVWTVCYKQPAPILLLKRAGQNADS